MYVDRFGFVGLMPRILLMPRSLPARRSRRSQREMILISGYDSESGSATTVQVTCQAVCGELDLGRLRL